MKHVILKTSTTMKGGVAGGVGGRKVGLFFDFGQDDRMVGMVMLSVIKWGRWLKW